MKRLEHMKEILCNQLMALDKDGCEWCLEEVVRRTNVSCIRPIFNEQMIPTGSTQETLTAICNQIRGMDVVAFHDLIRCLEEQKARPQNGSRSIDLGECFLCNNCKKFYGKCAEEDTDDSLLQCLHRFEKFCEE